MFAKKILLSYSTEYGANYLKIYKISDHNH